MQTIYDIDAPIGVEGQLIECYPHGAITGISEAGPINVGKLVIWDTVTGRGDKSVRVPAVTGDITGAAVAGIAQLDPTYPEPPYAQYKVFPVLRKGRILMLAETIMAKATHPFVRFAVGAAGTLVGSIRADADTANAVAAPYLTIITPTTAINSLCVVEINL